MEAVALLSSPTRALRLTLLLVLLFAVHSSALIIESPDCQLLTHVSGEFTNVTQLEEGGLPDNDIVPVMPFMACEPLRGQDLRGKVALVQRGECNFVQKVWNAQRAHASAVVVMDSHMRNEAPYHIIMQKDDMAANIRIPSVFVSYASGERLLNAINRAAPWDPVRVTIDANGELPQASTSNRLLKRVVAYVFLISIVCAFSSGLSLLSSGIFGWIGKTRRTRAAKQLPIAKYERNLQRTLLEHLLEDQFVLDRIPLTEIQSGSSPLSHNGTEDAGAADQGAFATVVNNNEADGTDGVVSSAVDGHHHEHEESESLATAGASRGSTDSDSETCPICLDDFENGADVKVLPCQHFFHVDCINPWLERRSGRCPLCKQDAIATIAGKAKKIFGIPLPRVDQILQQEHWVHTFFLMLPASFISCLIVNAAASIIGNMWP